MKIKNGKVEFFIDSTCEYCKKEIKLIKQNEGCEIVLRPDRNRHGIITHYHIAKKRPIGGFTQK